METSSHKAPANYPFWSVQTIYNLIKLAGYLHYVRDLLVGHPLWGLVTGNNYWKTVISVVLTTVTLLIQIRSQIHHGRVIVCNGQSRTLLIKFGSQMPFLD